jgi:hypothetical protein
VKRKYLHVAVRHFFFSKKHFQRGRENVVFRLIPNTDPLDKTIRECQHGHRKNYKIQKEREMSYKM